MAVILSHFCINPVGWGRIIHRLDLCGGENSPNECPGYVTKQSDGNSPVMLELWDMQSIPLLRSLPDPLWSEVVAPVRVLSVCQIELNCILMLN